MKLNNAPTFLVIWQIETISFRKGFIINAEMNDEINCINSGVIEIKHPLNL